MCNSLQNILLFKIMKASNSEVSPTNELVQVTSLAKMVPHSTEVPWQQVINYFLPKASKDLLLTFSPTVFGGFASSGELGGFGKNLTLSQFKSGLKIKHSGQFIVSFAFFDFAY